MIDSMRSSIFGFCSRRRTTSCARRLISLRFDEVIPSLLQTTERLYILKCIEFQLFYPALLVTPVGFFHLFTCCSPAGKAQDRFIYRNFLTTTNRCFAHSLFSSFQVSSF